MFKSKEQEKYFEDLLEKMVVKATKRTHIIRAANYLLTILILLLSAVLTIILGYNLRDNTYLIQSKNIALIIGATITFLSGLKTFWKLESYWVRRKITLRRIEDLRDEFNFEKLSEQEFDLTYLYSKYQSIQNYSTIYWEDVYKEVKTDKKFVSAKAKKDGN
jgi:hypothetical protein